ncbi:hypothetical protein Ga0123461_1585 [Mariprofundus aestuarium]|uniref:Uncharacterized protein n=1 Tax=Mariprofundus aestuarium TaxID=1921086 RepID=A0A2K8KYE7_MARES|nr:hypothetical protein [Mariprofundus aestuarium]ATX79998.1 hypothetical protein Ga0123461_1585 [Mariprofundus aestuarium]
MNEATISTEHEQFLEEHTQIREKVLRLKRIKNVIWLMLWLPSIALASFIAYNHTTMEPQSLAEFAIPLLKWGGLVCTIIYLAYIVLHVPVVRAIYQAKSVVFPRYNSAVTEKEKKSFQWHSYFSRKESNIPSGISVAFILGAKVTTLFLLIIFYQFSWIHALGQIGEELNNEHYSFMGFIDFALFSSLVLFAVVLIFTRVSSLAGKKG